MKKKEEVPLHVRLAEALEIPPELMGRFPEITLTGNRTLTVENHQGMVDCREDLVRLNTGCGLLTVEGECFDVLTITDEVVVLTGTVSRLRFGR